MVPPSFNSGVDVMTKPTYEELEVEVRRLRAKLSFGEDEQFTKDLKNSLPDRDIMDSLFLHNGYYIVRPAEMWQHTVGSPPSTRDLAKLGRSLQALGWARSARLGNVVFKIPVEEYQK
jgi:hypothetical protein